VHLNGYCFGSKPGRSPLQCWPTAAHPAASKPVSSVDSEYEPDAPPNQAGASPLAQANSITAEGSSRPTKRRCTRHARHTRHSAGAVPLPALSAAAVQDRQQVQGDTAIARGTSEGQNGNAKAAPDTVQVKHA